MKVTCQWCGKLRGILKGILICPCCEYSHDHATVIPNEHLIRDVNPRP